jgi:hypothetical protein
MVHNTLECSCHKNFIPSSLVTRETVTKAWRDNNNYLNQWDKTINKMWHPNTFMNETIFFSMQKGNAHWTQAKPKASNKREKKKYNNVTQWNANENDIHIIDFIEFCVQFVQRRNEQDELSVIKLHKLYFNTSTMIIDTLHHKQTKHRKIRNWQL